MITSHFLAKQLSCPVYGQELAYSSNEYFESEFSLVRFFEYLIDAHIDPNQARLLREFDCSNGIADLVLVELQGNWRRAAALSGIPPRWAYWLHCLPFPESFTTDHAEAIAGVSRRQALGFLRLLTDLGFCEKVRGGVWKLLRKPAPVVERIYAIEAKLRDWKRALSQAVRYREYSVQSWVLLDGRSTRIALDNIDKFERLNIGLATVSPQEEVFVHFIPHIGQPKSQLKFWQANAEIARRLTPKAC